MARRDVIFLARRKISQCRGAAQRERRVEKLMHASGINARRSRTSGARRRNAARAARKKKRAPENPAPVAEAMKRAISRAG
jgi:hypothetical protein